MNIENYIKHNIIAFSINIKQKYNDNSKKWKKELTMPTGWQKLTSSKYIKSYNGLALLTGKINNIIVIDIDNVEHWKKFLQKYNKIEPNTVKAESGSGGIHLYFKYTDDLEKISSTDHKFGKEFDIDLKTNGGCIIAPPTTYFNKNFNTDVSYKWTCSIFDTDPVELPLWIKNILFDMIESKKSNTIIKTKDPIDNNINDAIADDDCTDNFDIFENTDFTEDDIVHLVKMLSKARAEGYNDWINVGMCLYNLSSDYRLIWKEFSKKSPKYDEKENTDKWKSFRRNKNGLKVGSLLKWAKDDNKIEYEKFMSERNLKKMIVTKYPNDKLELGSIINVSDICKYIGLRNEDCLIKGSSHDGKPTNYIEVTKDSVSLKCSHLECFGKLHCNHMCMTKQETNMVFNGNVYNIVNIHNACNTDDELIEFQKIDLFDDEKLNELVYRSLNGKPVPFAEIIFYLYPDKYMFAEDDTWFVYNGNRWFCINKKNTDLRITIQHEFTTLYSKLKNYFISKEGKMSKSIKMLKQIMSNFDDTSFRNNVITELSELYLSSKNPERNFLQRLDTKQHLIGFVNGVYDLITFEFRNGRAEDCISMSTGYDYNDKHTEKYNELLQFLEDIQPNKEERDYMLTYLSIGLFGNQLELFTILTGCGRNGKSKLIELLGETLGDYFGSVQSQLFTRPRPDANSPDPGLLSLQRKRIVIASEPEKNAKLNSGFIKFITGRDSTTLRNCHSNDMIKFTAKFITLLICNDIPDCDDFDNAFSKRLRCIHFPTEFVDEPKKLNQKKINVNINNNFEYWKLDFILLLIDYYKKYKIDNKLNPTDNILKWTTQYQENTDLYLQYLLECTEESKNEDVHCSVLYESFKGWFKINNPHAKLPSNKEFVANIRKHKEVKKILIKNKVLLGVKNLKLIDDCGFE
ncbi:D5 family helicase-primase [Bodo saltans virus]|uniref:D5 family helicase-primase n=1 Tax=Bodo saltans virus TaxID=2024608 RepID=A0A2H4UTK5_9VIRU|nr:D5 family helicase-primase [Bodo saltans virus]ATZ80273.1 D5 family helicase-primase [Bodo saltans virus]